MSTLFFGRENFGLGKQGYCLFQIAILFVPILMESLIANRSNVTSGRVFTAILHLFNKFSEKPYVFRNHVLTLRLKPLLVKAFLCRPPLAIGDFTLMEVAQVFGPFNFVLGNGVFSFATHISGQVKPSL